MATSASQSFKYVLDYDGTSYVDRTQEVRTRRFDSSAVVDALNSGDHYLYLGHD